MTTIANFQLISRTLDKSLARIATRSDVKREAQYFLGRIGQIDTVDEFLSDDRLYRWAMEAHGLKDMTYAKAFMRKVLTEGIDGKKAFAVQLADSRFRDFAETFNFARYGRTATTFDRAQNGTVDKFLRVTLESDAGKSDDGVRLALYFQRRAPRVASIYGLMADPALYRVVQTALGLPQAISSVDIDRQAALIGAKIDGAIFTDKDRLDTFLMGFAARWQAAQSGVAVQVPQIGLPHDITSTMDMSTLISLQSLGRR